MAKSEGEVVGVYDETTLTRKLLPKLDTGQPSDQVYRSLVAIKTKYSNEVDLLVRQGLVAKLVQLLKRPNSKIVDLSLSILGNLLIHKLPREQVQKKPSSIKDAGFQKSFHFLAGS